MSGIHPLLLWTVCRLAGQHSGRVKCRGVGTFAVLSAVTTCYADSSGLPWLHGCHLVQAENSGVFRFRKRVGN